MATQQNFSAFAGETVTINVSCNRSDGTTPIDLTGGTVKFGIKKRVADVAFVVQKVAVQGGAANPDVTFSDAVNGLVTFVLRPADTTSAGAFAYDVVVVEANGTESVQGLGQFLFTDHPSR
jgi:hypothetical protein